MKRVFKIRGGENGLRVEASVIVRTDRNPENRYNGLSRDEVASVCDDLAESIQGIIAGHPKVRTWRHRVKIVGLR